MATSPLAGRSLSAGSAIWGSGSDEATHGTPPGLKAPGFGAKCLVATAHNYLVYARLPRKESTALRSGGLEG